MTLDNEQNGATGAAAVDMTEYCKKLESWLWKAYTQRALATSAYFTALNAASLGSLGPSAGGDAAPRPPGPMGNGSPPNAGAVPPPGGAPAGAPAGGQPQPPGNLADAFRRNNGQMPQFIVAGVVVKVAPIWKRLIAEAIDFVFLLVIKLFITFTIIDSFDLIDLDSIDLESLRNEAAAGDSANLQGLYDIAFSLTSELLLLELTHRIVVCFFEAYCLSKAGSTPGKTLMGLRVVQADDVLPYLPPPRNMNNNNNFNQQLQQFLWDPNSQAVIVRPGCFLTFPRAFARSALKNFSLAVFFPLCFTLFHFEYSRTLYDLMAKSIVIEV